MSTIHHNIENEKRLIELLGYSLIGPNGSNRWLIIDENQNEVGYIQYKKLYNGNVKKGYNKIFGYETLIDSRSIEWNFQRKINDKNGNYKFYIKRDNQKPDYVDMNIGEYPSLKIWREDNMFISFYIDYRGLFLRFKSKTDNFNIEEVLKYKNIDDEYINKEYLYQIRYSKKDHKLSGSNSKITVQREISGTQNFYDKNQLKISTRTWVGRKIRTNRDRVVEGTIEEMATKHQMGIDCFSHFRFLINQIIPFNEDVISVIVSNDIVKQNNLSIFFPDYEIELSESRVQKKLTRNKKNN